VAGFPVDPAPGHPAAAVVRRRLRGLGDRRGGFRQVLDVELFLALWRALVLSLRGAGAPVAGRPLPAAVRLVPVAGHPLLARRRDAPDAAHPEEVLGAF